jgi:penicillin-binding protein 2
VAPRAIITVGIVCALVVIGFGYRAFDLQVARGETYAAVSKENSLSRSVIFATRGVVIDRTGRELAWNEAREPEADAAPSSIGIDAGLGAPEADTFALRKYATLPGLAHLIGYVQYPRADASGNWWREESSGVSGVELAFDALLQGTNGSRMVETDAHGAIERENIVTPQKPGERLVLSIDAELQSRLHTILSIHAARQGFQGGAAVIMDVQTGELMALTSFPEFDNAGFTDGTIESIRAASGDPRSPMLNRAVAGLYAPGSIVKPIFAAAALNEGIISPEKQIHSVGALVVPNPYDPARPTIFRDWTVHGWVDMRTAIAVSSDEYFYVIGGGFGDQEGLGIARIDEYAKRFGLESPTGIALRGEATGVIPTPEWKERIFGPDDPWRIGNTYHTSIGQYGFQITPLQAVRFIAAIANGGTLPVPKLILGSELEGEEVGIPDAYLQVVRDGMRMAVTSSRTDATVKSLNIAGIQIAAKTGTAELGLRNESMNSWSVGYWPADDPKYAYAVVLEKAPAGTGSGAAPGLVPFFKWLVAERPEYLR